MQLIVPCADTWFSLFFLPSLHVVCLIWPNWISIANLKLQLKNVNVQCIQMVVNIFFFFQLNRRVKYIIFLIHCIWNFCYCFHELKTFPGIHHQLMTLGSSECISNGGQIWKNDETSIKVKLSAIHWFSPFSKITLFYYFI